jgi:hypothetical protein
LEEFMRHFWKSKLPKLPILTLLIAMVCTLLPILPENHVYAAGGITQDIGGNQESIHTAEVRIDTVPPEISINGPLTVWMTDPIVLNVVATDVLSGIVSSAVKLDGATVSASLNLQPLSLRLGQHIIEVTATDASGNTAVRTFVLKVIMDIDHLDDLLTLMHELGYFNDNGIYNSLQSKVEQIQNHLGDNNGHVQGASNAFDALDNELNAQDGKLIEATAASLLREVIQHLKQNQD